jgi:hypothetical protein
LTFTIRKVLIIDLVGTTEETERRKEALVERGQQTLQKAKLDSEGLQKEFLTWGSETAKHDNTWAFWWQFVQIDA